MCRVLRVHPGQQPGTQLQQISLVLESLKAESAGRWTVSVATHRRVQVVCVISAVIKCTSSADNSCLMGGQSVGRLCHWARSHCSQGLVPGHL